MFGCAHTHTLSPNINRLVSTVLCLAGLETVSVRAGMFKIHKANYRRNVCVHKYCTACRGLDDLCSSPCAEFQLPSSITLGARAHADPSSAWRERARALVTIIIKAVRVLVLRAFPDTSAFAGRPALIYGHLMLHTACRECDRVACPSFLAGDQWSHTYLCAAHLPIATTRRWCLLRALLTHIRVQKNATNNYLFMFEEIVCYKCTSRRVCTSSNDTRTNIASANWFYIYQTRCLK